VRERTIEDFGEQWTRYTDNDGYYGSASLFADVFGPLADDLKLRGARVGDVGAGTGRFVNIFLDQGAAHVVAVEPSAAMDALIRNTAARSDRVTYLRVTGDRIPPDRSLDYVFSIGVLHHIPDPVPVVRAVRSALKPGGQFYVWLYGAENNGPYLAAISVLRAIGTRAPHVVLAALVWLLYFAVRLYIPLVRILPLPLRGYMTEVLGRLGGEKIRLVIYDQLNPAYAKYYTRQEALDLLANAGFQDVALYHRHGYSWAVRGTNP
jgi:SAM-dependent methyltransferase